MILKIFLVSVILVSFPWSSGFSKEEGEGRKDYSSMFSSSDSIEIEGLNKKAYEMRSISPSESYSLAKKALFLSDSLGYQPGQMDAGNVIGIFYKNTGQYDLAIGSFLGSLKIAERLKDTTRISNIYNNMAAVNNAQGKYVQAIEYYKLSLEKEKILDNKPGISIRYYNLGAAYESLDSLDLAYAYYNNSLLIEEEIGNEEGIYFALYGLAGVETLLNQYDLALRYIDRALKIAMELQDPMGISNCFNQKARLCKALGQKEKAVEYFSRSLKMADSVKYKVMVQQNYKDLSEMAKDNGNYEQAYSYLFRYLLLSDTLNGLELNTRIEELKTAFEVEKKEHDLEELQLNYKIQENELIHQKKVRIYFILIFVLIIILVGSNMYRFKGKNK